VKVVTALNFASAGVVKTESALAATSAAAKIGFVLFIRSDPYRLTKLVIRIISAIANHLQQINCE
jgi:hypothetical protein